MRIAIGSDHRGGKIAKAILSEVLFPENYSDMERMGLDFRTVLVGAYLVTGDAAKKKGSFVGKKIDNILPNLDVTPDEESAAAPPGIRPKIIRVDYPDIAAAVAERVSSGAADYGILVCGTGIGMSVVADKFRGVRAAICYNESAAEMSRHHNNANVLCIPGEMLGAPSAIALVRKWLATGYDGGRHQVRLEKIEKIERETGL